MDHHTQILIKRISEKTIDLQRLLESARKDTTTKVEYIEHLEKNLKIAKETIELATRDSELLVKVVTVLDALSHWEAVKFPTEMSMKESDHLFAKLQELIDKKGEEYPKEMAVSNLSDLKQTGVKVVGFTKGVKIVTDVLVELLAGVKGLATHAFKAVITGEVKITNKELADAIPVRLASKDRSFFYDALVSVMGSGGSSLSDTILASISGAVGSSSAVGDGTTTLTTAGTRVQLTAQACKKVLIQAHESNTGTLVVGGANCVAALSGRRGTALFATQSQVFNVTNMNLLYIDSTVSGDKINFYYEN